jgi:uncharacterized protein (TIGR02646 family)
MRYIDLARVAQKTTPEWRAKAAKALADVRSALPEERSRAIDRHDDVWKDAKDLLRSASGRKCWYCESRETRSDTAVDHFRPKGAVADSDHKGYWWLAFDFKNYRYSCTYCNSRRIDRVRGKSGGKQSEFPLLNPDKRVFEEGEYGIERPVLLDPARASDTQLLYFREDGEVQPRYTAQQAREKEYRAARSIDIYHLRHTDLVEARLETLNRVRQLVDLGRVYYASWLADESDELAYEVVVAELSKLCSDESEYSAAVRDFLKGFRDDMHPWIDRIV